jgi:hypothetical protein
MIEGLWTVEFKGPAGVGGGVVVVTKRPRRTSAGRADGDSPYTAAKTCSSKQTPSRNSA